MFVNVWFGMRKTAAEVVKTRLRWNEETDGAYTGPVTDREARLFQYMADQPNVEKLWKVANLGGNDWVLWSIGFSASGNVLQLVRDELDALEAKYPSMVQLAGAWLWTGEQVGTEHEYTTAVETVTWSVINPDYQPDPQEPNFDDRQVLRITDDIPVTRITGMTGTPSYPINFNALLKFMPDILDADGNFVSAATELSDVNLSLGQAHRSFF